MKRFSKVFLIFAIFFAYEAVGTPWVKNETGKDLMAWIITQGYMRFVNLADTSTNFLNDPDFSINHILIVHKPSGQCFFFKNIAVANIFNQVNITKEFFAKYVTNFNAIETQGLTGNPLFKPEENGLWAKGWAPGDCLQLIENLEKNIYDGTPQIINKTGMPLRLLLVSSRNIGFVKIKNNEKLSLSPQDSDLMHLIAFDTSGNPHNFINIKVSNKFSDIILSGKNNRLSLSYTGSFEGSNIANKTLIIFEENQQGFDWSWGKLDQTDCLKMNLSL